MKNLIKLLSIFIIFTTTAVHAEILPEKIYVNQRYFSWTTTFDLDSAEGSLGVVYRKIFTLMPEYHLVDLNDQLMARARMRFWSLGASFDVYNHQGESLGSVEETFSWFFPTFTMYSPHGHKLAVAVLNFWGTCYTLSDPFDGHTIAYLTRPYFRLKNNWTVQICDPSAFGETKIHPHMFLTLLSFQVDMEYWAAINSINYTMGIKTPSDEDQNYESKFSQEEVEFIMSMTNFDQSTESDVVNELNELLESDELTEDQKETLIEMLNSRINAKTAGESRFEAAVSPDLLLNH